MDEQIYEFPCETHGVNPGTSCRFWELWLSNLLVSNTKMDVRSAFSSFSGTSGSNWMTTGSLLRCATSWASIFGTTKQCTNSCGRMLCFPLLHLSPFEGLSYLSSWNLTHILDIPDIPKLFEHEFNLCRGQCVHLNIMSKTALKTCKKNKMPEYA